MDTPAGQLLQLALDNFYAVANDSWGLLAALFGVLLAFWALYAIIVAFQVGFKKASRH